MVYYQQLDEQAKLRRQRTNEAIALAMQSKWKEAATVNKNIIEIFPKDAGAYNRLGKALAELGHYTKAKEAYSHALEIKPQDSIAKKNLERLSYLKEADPKPKNKGWVSPGLFIEETGKTEVSDLYRLAPPHVLAKMTAGVPVHLKVQGQSIIVENIAGEYIGEIEPKLGLRLIKLMEDGNKYTAAIARIAKNRGRVVIKETFRHPFHAERPSFPARAADGFNPYIKNSMVKYELEDEEETLEEEHPIKWEEQSVAEEPATEEIKSLEAEATASKDDDDGDELNEE
ncbi:tetratricopeptide repeat protein [Chloroflexota bacterium]